MKFPSVYPLTIPSSHRTMRMIAIVSSMCLLLDAATSAASLPLQTGRSNGCAVSGPWSATVGLGRALILCFLTVAVFSRGSSAQDAAQPQPQQASPKEKRVASFFTGAAIGLGAHEAGHIAASL